MDKQRPDDSALIDDAPAPAHGGTSGGTLQRDIGAQAEEDIETGQGGGEGDSVTRLPEADKPRGGDSPNLPNRD